MVTKKTASSKTASAAAKDSKAAAKVSVRVIKKYPNRRLYDTDTSSYITLAEVKRLVMKNEPFVVRGCQNQRRFDAQHLAANHFGRGSRRRAHVYRGGAGQHHPLLRQLHAGFHGLVFREKRANFHRFAVQNDRASPKASAQKRGPSHERCKTR